MEIKSLYVSKSKLEGTVKVDGAKNSALRLLAASILTSETLTLSNFPSELLDVKIHNEMLEHLGKKIQKISNTQIKITEESALKTTLSWNKRSIRNTLLILGALVSRFGEGKVPLPGGCKLGERKYDLHVMLLEKLGARVYEEDDYLCASAENGLVGTDIKLPLRSTGATENAILCSCLAKGVTRIWNPHIRPEILDLISMLNSMGAIIKVFGQQHIEVAGVEHLTGVDHYVIPDNMEAITWLAAGVMTKGEIEIVDFPHSDLETVLTHIKAAGAKYYVGESSIIVKGGTCYPIEISTGPHPGINSDVQPILAAWASICHGESKIIDLRFPGRYGYADELKKMGLSYEVDGDLLKINGNGYNLQAAEVTALDLRAGAALTLCGLTASGTTKINSAWQIQRGYMNFVEKLKSLNAKIEADF